MSTRRAARWMVGALLFTLAGCGGPRPAGPSAERDDPLALPKQPRPASPAVDATSLPAAGRVALRYTMAARSWTPANYRAQHRRQLDLSTGPLHRALQQAAPTRAQTAAYRADGARLEATLVAAAGLLQAPTQARYRFALDERSVAADETVRQRASYLVELRRHRGRWSVTAFTVEP